MRKRKALFILFLTLILLILPSACKQRLPLTVKEGDIVYYTPNGKSYHSTKDCPTLNHSYSILEGHLNASKGIPRRDPCDICVKQKEGNEKMDILKCLLFIGLGFLIGNFGLINILTILRFGFKFTNTLESYGLLRVNDIKKKYGISITFWLVVSLSALILVGTLATSYLWALGIGMLIPCLIGWSRTGANTDNYTDYFISNWRYFRIENINDAPEDIRKIIPAKILDILAKGAEGSI